MNLFNYIVWDPNPEIFSLGSWEMRWYGLLFAVGFLISQQIMFYIYRKEGKPERDVEALTFFMVTATVIGARLGHVLFYEPGKYLSNPIEILKIWEGGLASHGAAVGILLAIYFYSNYLIKLDFGKLVVKKRKRAGQNYMWVVDRLVIVVALTGGLIRMGNFINSEIVGLESKSDFGVVFAHDAGQVLKAYSQGAVESVEASKLKESENTTGLKHPVLLEATFVRGIDETTAKSLIEQAFLEAFQQSERLQADLSLGGKELEYTLQQDRGIVKAEILTEGKPRHPAQIYEAISSLLIFVLLFFIWKNRKAKTPPGLIFGIFLILLFGLRFIYEFVKENQVDFEQELALNMGQYLSIPLVLAGIVILVRSLQNKKTTVDKENPLTTSGS